MTEGAPDHLPLTCYNCERRMAGGMWSLTRSMQRVHFKPGLPEVEVEDAECLSYYCSHPCMTDDVPGVMRNERVPIPKVSPRIGPVELCAVCQKPIDMATFHRTYTLSDEKEISSRVLQTLWVEDIAVVCDECCRSDAAACEQSTAEALLA